MSYELAHDTIARQVFDKASTEARTRRRVERFVHERHAAFTERGAELTQDDLDYINPYRQAINISAAEGQFLKDGQSQLDWRRRRRMMLIAGIITVLAAATVISLYLYREADRQTGIALDKEKQAMKSDSLAQLRAEEAEEQRGIAQINADSALAAQQRAVNEAEIANTERSRAENARQATQTALNETESFELAYRSGVSAGEGVYLEALNLAWRSFLALPGKHSTDAILNVAHPIEEWNLATSTQRHQIEAFDYLRFSSDGRHYYTFTGYDTDSIAVWRTSDQGFLFKREVDGFAKGVDFVEDLPSINFSPDGKLLIAYDINSGNSKAWQLPSGRSANVNSWSSLALYALCFAQDIQAAGNDYYLLFGDGYEMKILSWNKLLRSSARFGEDDFNNLIFRSEEYLVSTLQIDKSEDEYFPRGVFSPDAGLVIMVEDDADQLARFDTKTGKRLSGFRQAEYTIDALAYPDHGRYIVAESGGAALVYDPALEQRLDSFQMTYPDYLDPSGTLFVGVFFNYIFAYNYDFIWSEQWLPLGEEVEEVVIGPKNGALVYQLADGQTWLQEMKIGGSRRQVAVSPVELPPVLDMDSFFDESFSFFFSSDEKFLLVQFKRGRHGAYQVFRTSDGKEIGVFSEYTALTFSPDARFIISCDTLGRIHRHPITNPSSAEFILDNEHPVERLVVSPESSYLQAYYTLSGSTRARLWNLKTEELHLQFSIPTEPKSCAFSQDERFLYFVPFRGFDGIGDYVYTLDIHPKELKAFLVSPKRYASESSTSYEQYLWPLIQDGKHYLMTVDGIWDVETGFQLESFKYQRGKNDDPLTNLIAVDPQARFTLQAKEGQIHRYPTILPNFWLGNIGIFSN